MGRLRENPDAVNLDDALGAVVGGKTAKVLMESLGIHTVRDLLSHYPRRYLNRGEMSDLGSLVAGEHVTVFAEVVSAMAVPMRQRKGYRIEVVVTDGTGLLSLVFFGPKWIADKFESGARGLFDGTVSVFNRTYQLTHPTRLMLAEGVDDADSQAQAKIFKYRMVPIYPATARISVWRIAQSVGLALDALSEVDDPLPEKIRVARDLMDYGQALDWIHRPPSEADALLARQRLKFDEAFILQLVLAQRRAQWRSLTAIPRTGTTRGVLADFDAVSPFALTAAQERVGGEISADLAAAHPMHRLLQGDVGSGKTLVALRAMLAVIEGGGQAALIAPTEVLAQQHAATLTSLLGSLGRAGMLDGADNAVGIELLTGSMSAAQRRDVLERIRGGSAGTAPADIVIGTHALFEPTVVFRELGLVVVDEQHRFGVEQRAALNRPLADGTRPHLLVMTATPIPRTVAMTSFGDLSVSVIDELPRGRQPISTHVIAETEQPRHVRRTWQRVREEVAAGNKAYVVCPRIGDGKSAGAEEAAESELVSVVEMSGQIIDSLLPDLRVGVLHGRLPADEKKEVMRRFALDSTSTEAFDVLVSTTVIEVGVDVPAATVMIIMDADRFGVSQLHQLRGRVGRGSAPSLCLMFTKAPADSPSRERLSAVAATTDGFELALLDLRNRREGDVLGVSQSGHRSSLRLLEVADDEDVIVDARQAVDEIVHHDPDLTSYPILRHIVDELRRDERADFLHKG